MSKHIASDTSVEGFLKLLTEVPQRGPGAVVGVLSAFLTDEEIATLTRSRPATVRGWRRDAGKRINPEAADKLDVVRVIAISMLRRSTTAWSIAGLGAWFRARNFRLPDDDGVPTSPLEALSHRDAQEVLVALIENREEALAPR